MPNPTIGRVLWYYRYVANKGHEGPYAAIICHVHSVKLVNLMVIDPNGVPRSETSVRLIQDNEEFLQFSYCAWPTREEVK